MQREMERHSQAPSGRFAGVRRDYTLADVERLSGSVRVEHTIARRGAERLWDLLQRDEPVRALGAVTGNQAMQMVRAGLESIYLSGWQVAADNNKAGSMYPDQSLYPSDSGPELVRRINNTLRRADQIQTLDGDGGIDWLVPIVADAEAGFGGVLNAFEVTPGVHRSRRRRHPYRRPARLREEMRPHGGESPDPHPAAYPQPARGPPRGRRHGGAHDHPRAHRCGKRQADHQRHRRAGPRVPHRRAHAGGLLSAQGGHELRALRRPRPGLCGIRRPHLDGDVDARSGTGAALRRRHPRRVSGQDALLQLFALPSTGRPISTSRPWSASSASWRRWATATSS